MAETITGTRSTPVIPSKPWNSNVMPKRILAIRLQAMGDMVITLPYLQKLRKALPENTKLDLLTREEVEQIPKNIQLFDKIYSIRGGRDLKKQLFYTGLLLPKLLLQRYDVVIDLQNNIISHIVRKTIMPKAWSEFDRFSPIAAGESTRLTIEAIGIGKCFADNSGFRFTKEDKIVDILKVNGWNGSDDLIVLNPAGAFITRNWPIENYIEFAKLWLERFSNSQFLMLGIEKISKKAVKLKNTFGDKLIDLVNKTTAVEAFAIIQKATFVLSEDSGLMHMAWVSGVPTLAMFGSTRSDRAKPLGDHTMLLHSSDLSCGNCMLENCTYSDTHCLTRYSAGFVFENAMTLMEKINADQTMPQHI